MRRPIARSLPSVRRTLVRPLALASVVVLIIGAWLLMRARQRADILGSIRSESGRVVELCEIVAQSLARALFKLAHALLGDAEPAAQGLQGDRLVDE